MSDRMGVLIEVVNNTTGHVEIHNLLYEAPASAFSFGAGTKNGFQLGEDGRWRKAMTAENIEVVLARTKPLGEIAWRQITTDDLPADFASPNRLFRNCWRSRDGKVVVDMPLARAEHMARIRRFRDARLREKDGEWMKEFSRGNQAGADAVEADRQKLRDAPQTIDADVRTAKTPEELKAIWPVELASV